MASVPRRETAPPLPSSDGDGNEEAPNTGAAPRKKRRRLTPEEDAIAADELQAHTDYLTMRDQDLERCD
jgi:hypothetical protein